MDRPHHLELVIVVDFSHSLGVALLWIINKENHFQLVKISILNLDLSIEFKQN